MAKALRCASYAALRSHADELASRSLGDLFAADPERSERLCRSFAGIRLDLSRQRFSERTLHRLIALADEAGMAAARAELFAGGLVNRSEQRAALHMALRAGPPEASDSPPRAEARRLASDTLEQMLSLAESLRAGDGSAFGLERVEHLVSIGIGGSDLGPRLACQALGQPSGACRVHFLSNLDVRQALALLPQLNPRRTLVTVVSKSFGTAETLANAALLREWLCAAYAGDEQAALGHFLAVTSRPEAAASIGIRADRILPFWDWVGGRYSLWSAVGLPVAVAHGAAAFRGLLAGAAAMDRHFQEAPANDNLPLLFALTAFWNRNILGFPSQAVVPYDERLALLPEYLQQLEMESNGKGCEQSGAPLGLAGAPVIWGGVGSNVQHAFFQSLHQGLDVVPVDFIAAAEPGHERPDFHRALLANLLAQAAALAFGRSTDRVLQSLTSQVPDPEARLALARQRSFPGNRPSTVLLLERLDPQALGALIALYEHKVFVLACLLGNNPFDQWGVELGKVMATQIAPLLEGNRAAGEVDGATLRTADWLRSHIR